MTKRTPVLHWYDFLCPFCYVAQDRNALLVRCGFDPVEMAFQIHPEIPKGGVAAGARTAPMYRMLEDEAARAGLPLDWPPRLPNSRPALAAAEWVRRRQPNSFPNFQKSLFKAHFASREDIEDQTVIGRHAREAGVDVAALTQALASGVAEAGLSEGEEIGREYGVRGTPAWLLKGRLLSGLLSSSETERWIAGEPAPET